MVNDKQTRRLEETLESLRPTPASGELRARVRAEIEAPRTRGHSHRVRATLAVVGGIAAAALVVIVATKVLGPGREGPGESPMPGSEQLVEGHPKTPDDPLVVMPDNALDELARMDQPAVWVYQRAATRSMADLEEVLDRHALVLLPAGDEQPVSVGTMFQ